MMFVRNSGQAAELVRTWTGSEQIDSTVLFAPEGNEAFAMLLRHMSVWRQQAGSVAEHESHHSEIG